MAHPDMLYINCKHCGGKMGTGIVISRDSKSVLQNNTSGPCPNCGKNTTWSDYESFYSDGTPFKSK